jgi:hypothetical protein
VAKYLLFFSFVLAIGGCGNKSKITGAVEAERMPDTYRVVLPLSDQAIASFDSPLAKVNILGAGLAKMFMNFGASMGLGKMQLSLIQPMPELPVDYVKGASIKRLFFYIEPKAGPRQHTWFQRTFEGQSNVNFDFLNKLAVKVSSYQLEKQSSSWIPTVVTKSLKKRDFSPLQAIFAKKEEIAADDFDAENDKEFILVKYDRANSDISLKNNSFGTIYIINTTEPGKTRIYLQNHPKFKNYFKRIHTLNHSLIVELVRDPIVEESFKMILSDEAESMDQNGIKIIDQCNIHTCLDLSVPDVNLIPLLTKGNGLKIDSFFEATQVPESFQLKGFVDFEVKVNLGF